MAQIKGVIFDVDGTLVDSNEAHARAWVEAFGEFGITVWPETVRPLIGMGGDKIIPQLSYFHAESKEAEELSHKRSEIFKTKYLPDLQPFPMVRQLVMTLKEQGLKVAIATSAKTTELEPLLKKAQVQDFFQEKTSSDDAENSKPDPDILCAALEKLKLEAHEVLMIGDTPYDMEAARRAGIKCLGFTCGGWPEQKLLEAGASQVYKDASDLYTRFQSSPLAQKSQ